MKKIDISKRLKTFPPYLFAEIDRQKMLLRQKGIAFIDVSIGDPDVPAPQSVIEALYCASGEKENQKYALDQGKLSLRRAIAEWSKERFAVSLDENTQILPLIGSKEGLIHFPLAYVNPGDYIILPSPGYPGYSSAARFVDAKIYALPLLEKARFLPDLQKIPQAVRNKAKLMYLNYPHNPTSAVAPLAFLEEAVKFCSKYGIILAYDNAYSEIYFEEKPHSILEVEGADEVAIEFHSFSKTFCMTGFRLGWAAGNASFIASLGKVKSNVDSGIFGAIQEAGVVALKKEGAYARKIRDIFKERRDYFVSNLKKCGYANTHADSTFYVWTRIPAGYKSSVDFSKYLLSEKNIVATPGVGFGTYGEGFIRFALTQDVRELEKVFKRLRS